MQCGMGHALVFNREDGQRWCELLELQREPRCNVHLCGHLLAHRTQATARGRQCGGSIAHHPKILVSTEGLQSGSLRAGLLAMDSEPNVSIGTVPAARARHSAGGFSESTCQRGEACCFSSPATVPSARAHCLLRTTPVEHRCEMEGVCADIDAVHHATTRVWSFHQTAHRVVHFAVRRSLHPPKKRVGRLFDSVDDENFSRRPGVATEEEERKRTALNA